MHLIIAAVLALASATSAVAQGHPSSGYAAMQGREIKSLSPEQMDDLREGRGMGASLPAELNGIPGPMHVLQLKEQLKISAQQQEALERITAEMKATAQQLGREVIAAEADLDHAFKTGAASEQRIRDSTRRIGELGANLRAVHLVAHLKTRQLLSADQVVAYNDARGYGAASAMQPTHNPTH